MKQIILAAMLIAVPVAAFTGLQVYTASADGAAQTAGLGDLSPLKAIIADVQTSVASGDMAAARKRMTDYESAWDEGETAMRPLNPVYWGNVDGASDAALKAVRQAAPAPDKVAAALAALTTALDDPSKPVR